MTEKTGCDNCKTIWFWFIQISLWGAIIFLVLALVKFRDQQTLAIVLLVGIWLTYVINSLCSSTCSYLKNKQQNSTIHSYMLGLFKSRPSLHFHVQCYHNETRHHTTRDKDGHTHHHTTTVRVNTWSESRLFNYMSSRDCSGLFRLDCEGIRDNPGKYFIKLHLKLDVRNSNDGTQTDYFLQRDHFYNTNRWRDSHMDTRESTTLSDFNEYNLVSIGNEKPPCVSLFYFVLLTFLGFVQFYKWYVESYCITQNYKIIKEISTRRNLNAHEFNPIFNEFMPQIIIKDQIILKFEDPSSLPFNSVQFSIPEANEVNDGTLINNQVGSNIIPNSQQYPMNNNYNMTNQNQNQAGNMTNKNSEFQMTMQSPAQENNQAFQSNVNNHATTAKFNNENTYNNQDYNTKAQNQQNYSQTKGFNISNNQEFDNANSLPTENDIKSEPLINKK